MGVSFVKQLFLKTKKTPKIKVKKFDNKISKKQHQKRVVDEKVPNIKVQKADYSNIIKNKLSQKNKYSNNSFNYKSVNLFGLLNNFKILKSLVIDFRFKNISDYFKALVGQNLLQLFTVLFVKFIIIFSLISLLHLSILDTNYLIQDWDFKYTKNTFLDQKRINKIVDKFQDERMLGIFPSNQYWFANEKNLTYLARDAVPQIKTVKILNRNFPNKVTLGVDLVETISILVLDINNNKQYWRVDKYGNTFSQDYSGKYANLVYVDTPVIFEDSNKEISDLDIFRDDLKQLDKIYFTVFIRQLLENLNYTPTSIRLSSINPADGVVNVYLGINTFLRFDVYKLDKKNLEDRVKEVLKSQTLKEDLKSENINYIDLSIPKKVFVCYKIYACNIK